MGFDVKITTKISILDLVAPYSCMKCGKLGEPICECCKKDNIQSAAEICPRCRKNRKMCRCIVPVYGAAWRDGLVQEMVKEYKYGPNRGLVKDLAELVNEALPRNLGNISLVPLPTIAKHVRERGFDHTLRLARKLARMRKNFVVERAITRHDKSVQVGAGEAARKSQAKAAYELASKKMDPEKTYLLLDDVWTTGASMEAAIELLKKNGCKNILGAVVAMSR